jgi:TonB-linked SusC/RagA family outer membrane protein
MHHMRQHLQGHSGATRVHPPLMRVLLMLPIILCAVMQPRTIAAQATGTIIGTVVDAATGQAVSGAQIFVRGTQRGTVTDVRGAFAIPNVTPGQVTVRFESIGFRATDQTVTVVAGQTVTSNFSVQASALSLDEIVVTGTAGQTTRRAIGNSVAMVKAAAITEVAPISNAQQILQGRTAGVTVLSTSGNVGGASRIRVRGSSTLSTGNDPVVYVDGVRFFSGNYAPNGNAADGVSLLEAINPNDIESIEIIKGPAAATLYGADAATGVIQIITKKGSARQGLQWDMRSEYGQIEWNQSKVATYWRCEDEHIDNPVVYPGCQVFDKSTPREDRLLVDHPLEASRRSAAVVARLQERGLPLDRFACVYPQQTPCEPEPLRTGNLWHHNLSVRGGGEGFNFYISGERADEQGTFVNNINKRTSGRANFSIIPSQKAHFSLNLGYALLDQRQPLSNNSSNSVLRNAMRGQAGSGVDVFYPGYRNFSPEFSNKDDTLTEFERLTMGITANVNPFPWFQNRLTIGMDRNNRTQTSRNQIDLTGLAPFGATNATGAISVNDNFATLYTVDYSGTVTAELSENYTSAFSVGMQLNKRVTHSRGISGNGLIANSLSLVSSAANRNASQGFSGQTGLGFYIQEQIGWRDRLFGTAAVRVDDNSAFGREFSLVVYPKASVSYVISEEDYFNVSWVDDLKLRAAWGQAGNVPSPFSADRTYGTGVTVVNDASANRLSTSAYGNPNLKAETGQELELGFDGSLFGGRVGTEFNWYYKQTKDALLSVSAPPSSGWTGSRLQNVGEILNTGLELSLDTWVIRKPQLHWDVTATFATNRSELVSFGRDAQGDPILTETRFGEFVATQRHREGYPLGGYWAQDVLRDENGQVVLDASGRAIVPECTWPAEQPGDCTEEYMGPLLPTRQVGLTNTLTIKGNLRLYVFLDYQGGHWQWCAICSVRNRLDLNTRQMNDPRLHPSHPEWESFGKYERARLLSLQTTEYIHPADFIKLREASINYALPQRLTARMGLSRASISISGRNLWLGTKYGGGDNGSVDPEVAFTSTSEFTVSDYANIPMQRRWHISTNFSF